MRPEELNDLGEAEFVEAVGWVFEDSPWVAERAWTQGPFGSVDELSCCMNQVVDSASREEQLTLLRAHPDLGTRAKVSVSSEREQMGAGLDSLSAEEFEDLSRLNATYRSKFGFPFLYAVKGSNKFDILDALRERVDRAPDEEFVTALQQVHRIARFRLEDGVRQGA